MQNIELGFGLKPSPKDERDYKLHEINAKIGYAPATPVSYLSDISQLPVLMQGTQPSCVGHATAAGMMWKDNGAWSWDYSPRYLYDLCKRDDGDPNEGTFYRQALKEANSYGVCDNAEFPNDVTLPYATYVNWNLIPANAFSVASDRKVQTYVSVQNLTFQSIKDAIYQNGVVLLGVEVGKEWYTSVEGIGSWVAADVLPVRPPATVISGHAILAYGFDANYIYFRNSWSTEWGNEGNGYFGINYMPFVQEAWTFMDLDPVVVNQVKQQELTWIQKAQQLIQTITNFLKQRSQTN